MASRRVTSEARTQEGPDPYEVVAYPTHPNQATHPDRMATVARLCGLAAPAPERCRYLELGCGDGSNIIPMAVAMPQASFVGIDLSGAAIARGQALAERLGVANLRLERGDIAALDESLGTFDYVAAHGVYSWVPPPVRTALLALCGRVLSETGVAFVSYNAMPGGHVRRMLRDMMLFHVRNAEGPEERVAEARALLGFLLNAGAPNFNDAYRHLMFEQAQRIAQANDADVFHDDLAPINEPVHVVTFVSQAAEHGLQFLAEADFFEMSVAMFVPEAQGILEEMAAQDIVMKEQYRDFLTCRQFRKTLLCRAGQRLDHRFDANRLTGLHASLDAVPAESLPDDPEGSARYTSRLGGSATAMTGFGRAVFDVLSAAYPASLSFSSVSSAAAAASGEELSGYKLSQRVSEVLWSGYDAGTIDLHTMPRHIVTEPAERPLASALARFESETSERVTNLRHETVGVEGPMTGLLVRLLDGTRDRAELLEALEAHRTDDWPPVADMPALLEANLRELGKTGILVR